MRAILLATASVLFPLGLIAAERGGSEPRTVCDLFENLPSHAGRTVQVRGSLNVSRHGWVLSQSGCPFTFSAEKVSWPTALDLRRGPVSEIDKSALEKLDKVRCFLNESTPQELGVEISATFVGVLSVRTRYLPQVGTGGQMRGGYGPFGAYAAQLVYSRIKEVIIREKPAEASREK